ncbi:MULTISPECIES: DegV family protein [Clostridia]|uniref:Dihydroxyacetone kinase n=1 Tax=Butyribacter intestini TaxID=1703332 RepID=A0AAW3JQ97_9FIRM|nr:MULTISPECIES: DegV family protein [Clostridia]KQC84354.1 dihydroxyacetone kinase [Butyribacter intestini]RHP25214.1 DegV family protein [Clostridium sp. AF34-13]RHU72412.1 DegV family protein [Butyribacter intestini]
MSRIAVITDSNSGINFEDAKELGIKVLPMPFLIDGKTYFEEISLSQEEFFEKLENDVDISTSQPSPESVMKIWDEALEEADEVVYIPMSSGLSSSCHTALMLADDYDGKVQVVDNQRISVTQRQSVLDAMELAKRGLTAVQIKEKLEKVKFESSIYIMLDTLKYLKKGGRITPAAAAVGSALRLKPVLTIQGEKLDAYAIAKTKKQGVKKMLAAIEDDINKRFGGTDHMENIHMEIAHTKNPEAAEDLKQQIIEKFGVTEVDLYPLSLSIACHIGPGSIAVACSKVID